MKRSIRFGSLLLVLPLFAAAVTFWAGPAQAVTLYWDMNGTAAGASYDTSPSGVWNQGNVYWNRDPNGTDEYGECIPSGPRDNLVFSAGSTATGDYTITLSGTRSADSITVKDGTPTFSGSKLVLYGTGSIDTTTRDPLFNVVIGGSVGLAKTGPGTLTLDAANTYTGLTIVKAGTLKLNGVNVSTTPNMRAWAPVLTGTGSDIQGGKMVFDYTGGATPASTIQGLLTTSYAGGAWNTGQFNSTTADASHGLGWADSGASQVKVAYTFYGDTTLDGSVDATDLAKVLANYNQLANMVWSTGDFNYDAAVDSNDLAKVLANYNQGPIVPGITAVGVLDAQAIQRLTAAGFTVVPEPGTLALLAAGLLGLLAYAWRRRRS